SREVVEPSCGALASRSRQHVAHGEDAMSADQPFGCDQRAFGEDAPVARDVLEMNLLERCVEYELVRARNGSGAHTRNRDLRSPRRGRRMRERRGRAGWCILLRGVMR